MYIGSFLRPKVPKPAANEEQWEPPEDIPGGWKCAHGCGYAD